MTDNDIFILGTTSVIPHLPKIVRSLLHGGQLSPSELFDYLDHNKPFMDFPWREPRLVGLQSKAIPSSRSRRH